MIATTIVAAVVRFWGLGSQPLWMDEAAAVHFSSGSWLDVVQIVRHYESNPPLFYLMENTVIRLFGASDAETRLISALAGIIAVPSLFLLLRRAGSNAAGLVATAMLSLCWIHIYYSQEARPYALLVLLSIVCTERLLAFVGEKRAWAGIGYIITAIAMCYTHYYGCFVLLAHAAAIAAAPSPRGSARIWHWMTGVAAACVILIALAPAIPHLLRMRIRLSGSSASWRSVAGQLAAFVDYAGSIWLLVLIILAAVAGLCLSRIDRWIKILLVGLAIIPVLGPTILSLTSGPAMHPRHGIAALVGLLSLAAIGATSLRRWSPVAAVILIIACGVMLWQRQDDFRKPAMRQAAQLVARDAGAGDTVVVSPFYAGFSFDRYVGRTDLRRRSYDEFTAGAIVRGQPGMKHLWVVLAQSPMSESAFMADSHMPIVGHSRFFGVDVYELTSIE